MVLFVYSLCLRFVQPVSLIRAGLDPEPERALRVRPGVKKLTGLSQTVSLKTQYEFQLTGLTRTINHKTRDSFYT